jgi:hypothetical protein
MPVRYAEFWLIDGEINPGKGPVFGLFLKLRWCAVFRAIALDL